MPRPRFSQEQVMAALRDIAAGQPVKLVSRKHRISAATLYRWKGTPSRKREAADERLRSLELENRRLKSQFAELALDYSSLRAALIKDISREC